MESVKYCVKSVVYCADSVVEYAAEFAAGYEAAAVGYDRGLSFGIGLLPESEDNQARVRAGLSVLTMPGSNYSSGYRSHLNTVLCKELLCLHENVVQIEQVVLGEEAAVLREVDGMVDEGVDVAEGLTAEADVLMIDLEAGGGRNQQGSFDPPGMFERNPPGKG